LVFGNYVKAYNVIGAINAEPGAAGEGGEGEAGEGEAGEGTFF